MNEEWKSIPGYEGLYEASNTGKIRTAEGKTTSNARYPIRIWKQRILKPKYEYRKGKKIKDARVSLWKDGKEKTMLVARLVAMAWCDGYQEGYTVNHIDGDPLNNNADNLEWLTLRENIQRGFQDGLYASQQRPCELIDKDGKSYRFASLAAANRFLGKDYGYMNSVVSHNRNAKSSTGEIYTVFA